MLQQPQLMSRPLAIPIPLGGVRLPWLLAASDHYTLVEPVEGPYIDQDVLDEIHTFDADAVPLWRRQLWMRDDATRFQITCIGIGRYNPDPKQVKHQFRIEVPPGYCGPVPNQLDFWWAMRADGRPDLPLPFDWRLARRMRESYDIRTAKQFIRDQKERAARVFKAKAASIDRDAAYRAKDFQKSIATVHRNNTLRELQQQFWAPPPRRPFVLVGRFA